MARWLGPLFAARPRRHSSATGAAGLESLPSPRRAPTVAPRRAPAQAPKQASASASQEAPKVASRLASSLASGAVRNAAPLVAADAPRQARSTEPETYLSLEDCEFLGLAKELDHSRKSVRRILDGQYYRGLSAHDHARELLEHLGTDQFLAGHVVPAGDLAVFYQSYCRFANLKELAWQTVAAQLNRLTGGKRLYRCIDGRRMRVYPIPPFSPDEHDDRRAA